MKPEGRVYPRRNGREPAASRVSADCPAGYQQVVKALFAIYLGVALTGIGLYLAVGIAHL